jgi:hypothetical protein
MPMSLRELSTPRPPTAPCPGRPTKRPKDESPLYSGEEDLRSGGLVMMTRDRKRTHV